jgi:hypothetical protein
MSCHAMHPIRNLFLECFSYVLQIDMHFICTSMLTKFYSCKKWVLHFDSLVVLVCWCVWLQRNDRVFNGVAWLAAVLVDHILALSDQWCRANLVDRSALYVLWFHHSLVGRVGVMECCSLYKTLFFLNTSHAYHILEKNTSLRTRFIVQDITIP